MLGFPYRGRIHPYCLNHSSEDSSIFGTQRTCWWINHDVQTNGNYENHGKISNRAKFPWRHERKGRIPFFPWNSMTWNVPKVDADMETTVNTKNYYPWKCWGFLMVINSTNKIQLQLFVKNAHWKPTTPTEWRQKKAYKACLLIARKFQVNHWLISWHCERCQNVSALDFRRGTRAYCQISPLSFWTACKKILWYLRELVQK